MDTTLHPDAMEAALLPCISVTDGLFSSERAVEVSLSDSQSVSFFAEADCIVKRGEANYVKVFIVGENGKPGFYRVMLPSEAFENGSRFLSIRLDQLIK